MKKLIGLAIILVALVLGGYYGMGIATEKTIKNHLQQANKTNGVRAEILNYHRGWFVSKAELKWQLHVPEHVMKDSNGQAQTVAAEDYEVLMPLTIHHGPIIFANRTIKFGLGYAFTDLKMPAKVDQKFVDTFTAESIKPKMNLSLLISYLRRSTVEMDVPDFKVFAKQGGELDWLGLTHSISVSPDADNIQGDLLLNGARFSKDDVKAILDKVTSTYSLHKTAHDLYLGDASIELPSVSLNQKEQTIFALTDAQASTSSDINDDLFFSFLKGSFKKLVLNNREYGPAKIKLSIKNLDANSLARINQQMTKVQQGSDLEKQQALIAVLPEFPKLLSRGPEFEISQFKVTMPQGDIDGNLFIALPVADNMNPVQLLAKLHGQGKLSIPIEVVKLVLNHSNIQKLERQQATSDTVTPENTSAVSNTTEPVTAVAPTTPVADPTAQVAEMTTAQLNQMVESGFFVQNGNHYEIEVIVDQGQVKINGKPFDSNMLKF